MQEEDRRRYLATSVWTKLKSPRKNNAIKGPIATFNWSCHNKHKEERSTWCKKNLSQKLITDVLKPDENVSPKKKVRKIRKSLFNKKSGSVLGRSGGSMVESEGLVGSLSSVNLEVLFGESGSEKELEEEYVTDVSNFEKEHG